MAYLSDPVKLAVADRYFPALRLDGIDPRLGAAFGWAESEWNVDAAGDYDAAGVAHSHGFLQVNDIHRIPRAELIGIAGAMNGYTRVCRGLWRDALRLPRYRDAADRWRTDPVGFLGDFGPAAQGAEPAYYAARAAVSVAAGRAIYAEWLDTRERPFRGSDGHLQPTMGQRGRGFGVVDVYTDPAGHIGIDYGANLGDQVRAVRAGVVIWSAPRDRDGRPVLNATGLGLCVIVRDAAGVEWFYGHNSALRCYIGQEVALGETIALAGETGYAFGVHSHLGRRVGGVWTDPYPALAGDPPDTAGPDELPAPVQWPTVTASGGLNVREAPGVASRIVGSLPDGGVAACVLAGNFPADVWAPVLYSGRVAWVYGAFLAGTVNGTGSREAFRTYLTDSHGALGERQAELEAVAQRLAVQRQYAKDALDRL